MRFLDSTESSSTDDKAVDRHSENSYNTSIYQKLNSAETAKLRRKGTKKGQRVVINLDGRFLHLKLSLVDCLPSITRSFDRGSLAEIIPHPWSFSVGAVEVLTLSSTVSVRKPSQKS